jgi:hypothetical protein
MSLKLNFEYGQSLGETVAQIITDQTQTEAPEGTESGVAKMFTRLHRRTVATVRETIGGAGAKTARRAEVRKNTWLKL